jgi:hypothetical protein
VKRVVCSRASTGLGMEPEAQVLRDKCKRALGDPVAMALLAYRLERHGCLLLLWLYADVEVTRSRGDGVA